MEELLRTTAERAAAGLKDRGVAPTPASNASGRDGLTSSSIVPSPSSIPRTYATPSPALALRRRPARVPSLKRLTVRLKTSTSLGLEGPQLGGFETGFWRRSRLLGTIPLTMTKNPKYPAAAIPYLMIRGTASAIDFYKKAFGAKEAMRFPGPGGTVGHAEIRIEGAPVYLADEGPGAGLQSPQQLGGTPVSVCIYVKDVDEFARRAEKAGATVLRPLADQFYRERTVSLQDPFGHVWHFSTVKEKLTVEQMMQRMPQ